MCEVGFSKTVQISTDVSCMERKVVLFNELYHHQFIISQNVYSRLY